MPELNLDELERLAKAAYLPWHIHKECQLDDQHEEIRDARGFYVKTLNTDRGKYCLAACNAVPELIAEDRALRERVRELERQRYILARRLVDAPRIPVKAYSVETWIELAEITAKEAGE